MKISEIIVESRSQLDEGMMDTIKSKLSSVYQQLNKMPGFSKVVQQVKTHSGEVNKIAQSLRAKSQSGQLTKQDVLATVMPLAREVSSEMGSKLGQPDSPMLDSLTNYLMSSLSGSKQAVQESNLVLKEDIAFGIGMIVVFIVGAWVLDNLNTSSKEQGKVGRVKSQASEAERQELIKNIKEKYKGELSIKGISCGMSESEVKAILGTTKPSPGSFVMAGLKPYSVSLHYDKNNGHLKMIYIRMLSKEKYGVDAGLDELVDLLNEKNRASAPSWSSTFNNDGSNVHMGKTQGYSVSQEREDGATYVNIVFTSKKYDNEIKKTTSDEKSKKMADL